MHAANRCYKKEKQHNKELHRPIKEHGWWKVNFLIEFKEILPIIFIKIIIAWKRSVKVKK